jgi:DNA mismatch repair ATPase MutS
MAHCGCFVPAEDATIGLVHRILTRLASAQSCSFAQDLVQLSSILRTADERSLVLIDEFGKVLVPYQK